jgi:uncharacterized protein YbjT (DUF2867 family)
MIGQGVLRECLIDPDVEAVVSIVRSPSGQQHVKLREIVPADFYSLAPLKEELTGFDACFFCLGVSSAGMNEENYRRVTYDITLGAAQLLVASNPKMTFIYVSGTGTDSTEKGRVMWARVKGQTENALLRLPFNAACMFRPGMVVPLDGIKSKTPLYNFMYSVLAPVLPLVRRLAPKYITTTEIIGRAMLKVAKNGPPKTILENSDFESL